MLTVFNVGQGDSSLIESDFGCIFDHEPLLIDCGLSKEKIHTKFSNKSINVMLSHSHQDHIGGFPGVLKNKAVKRIYIPYYLPELMRIKKFLGKHASLSKLGRIDWKKIADIDGGNFNNQNLSAIREDDAQGLYFVKEGDELCGHTKILNPPKDPFLHFPSFYGAEEVSIERALAGLLEFGMELPQEEIINYTPLQIINTISANIDEDYSQLARQYVYNFFKSLYGRANQSTSQGLSYITAAHLELTANQASIVMQYQDNNKNIWLFTGDADQSVFNRIINERRCSLKADYLKVPHHGSRENLSLEILKHIDPSVAVISHGNRKFGRSKDTHPHHEIIDMLDSYRTETYYTNNVIKSKKLIKKAAVGSINLGSTGKMIKFA